MVRLKEISLLLTSARPEATNDEILMTQNRHFQIIAKKPTIKRRTVP